MFSFFTCAHPPCTRWKSNTCECFADSRKPPAMATASVAVVSSRRSNFPGCPTSPPTMKDRKSTRLNSSHVEISYAVFCLKKKKTIATSQEAFLNQNEPQLCVENA